MKSNHIWFFVAVCLCVWEFYRRFRKLRLPSVTDRDVYREVALKPLPTEKVYENPHNYERKIGKLVTTSEEVLFHEKRLNSAFRDRIPWCLPPVYGDVEMKGPFPSIKACRLESLTSAMKSSLEAFSIEFNKHKDEFVENPEHLGYGNRYGKIDVNEVDGFAETRKILGQHEAYARTQRFNSYAQYNFMSTTFTVLYPGASIRPHFGPTNYKYRIHLCLDIDGEGGIVTAYGTRYWKAGQIFILDDSYLHAGFYEGTRPRVILMVDIAKPGLNNRLVEDIFTLSST